MSKLAYTVPEVVNLAPFGRSTVWELIRTKRLPAWKRFGRVYVFHDDLMNLLRQGEPA